MGQDQLGLCQLCNHRNCALLHILNCCSYSLQKGRYNWRHDQTCESNCSRFGTIHDEANRRKLLPKSSSFISTIAFRTVDGTTYRNPALCLPKDEVKDILTKASDWIFLMVEEYTQVAFPPEIVETAKRP